MGIKGTVRRSTDGDFIHANVDIDLIIDEEAEPGSLDKPVEMFHIIEHFCLGERQMIRHALLMFRCWISIVLRENKSFEAKS